MTLSSPKFNDGLNQNFVGGIRATQLLKYTKFIPTDVKDVSYLEILQTKSLTKQNVGLSRNLVGDIMPIGRFRIEKVVP